MKMKKRFLGILLSLAMVLGLMPGMCLTALAENTDSYFPVEVTGFDKDIIIDSEYNGSSTVNSTIGFFSDYENNKWAATFYSSGCRTNGAIPSGEVTTTTGKRFNIQPSTQNNVVQIYQNHSATLTFSGRNKYEKIAVLSSGGNGNLNVGVTINYSDNTTDTAELTSRDWYVNASYNDADYTIVKNLGGVTCNGVYTEDTNRGLYEDSFTVNSNKTISSITFSYKSGGNAGTIANIFAVSGVIKSENVRKVQFNSMGGSSVEAQTVTDGGTATEPSEPKKDGFLFAGWSTKENSTDYYDFGTVVKKDLTLYAQWAKIKLDRNTLTVAYNNTEQLTAAVIHPEESVIWSVSNDKIELYSNADCTEKIGTEATKTLTVYVKGMTAGSATVTVSSSSDKTKTATCTVTVGKAENPATVTSTATVIRGGNTVDLKNNVTLNGATDNISYAISGEANGCTLSGSVLTSGNNTGTVTVNVTVAEDDNYNASAAMPITVTISDKQTQTITASDVTVTYGDTDKKVSATTDGDGAISYAIKSGDAVTVNATTGALTIAKAGSAVVTVTAAETAAYAQATKDVNVTVNAQTATAGVSINIQWDDLYADETRIVGSYNGEEATFFLSGTVLTNNTGKKLWISKPTDDINSPTWKLANGESCTLDGNYYAVTADDGYGETSSIVFYNYVPVTGIEFTSSKPLSVAVGEEKYVLARTIPADATRNKVSYTSSNEKIAKITEKYYGAYVTGVSDGTATITATSVSDPTKTTTYTVTVGKAEPIAPTGLTATYGQTLANVSLPTGWTWADDTQSVGDVVSPAVTFKANFAGNDNYKAAFNVDVAVTVNKAANPAMVADTATVIKGGNTVDLANNVTKNGATGDVGYAIYGEANGCTLSGSVLTSGNNTGTVTVNVTVAEDDNYNASEVMPITVTISDKGTQTITAADVTVTYGDTDKKVSATTDGDGAISYAIKSGDAVTVNATTGALTIAKAGSAVVTVTAAETAAYAQATKDVNVTINKANAVPATVTANNRDFDGTEKPLVTVDDSTLAGGTMQYALGTATEATGAYTASVPAATDAGTYYVWYKAVGDEEHSDSALACVTTVIKGQISATVTFKVVNGSWNNGEETTADRKVTLTGKEGDVLKLTADQIPAVGEKPADGYKAGAWNVTPSTEVEIKEDTTFIYTYLEKAGISATVTFKVVNGSWNDGEGEAATSDRTVVLTGKEGDVLKLTAEQIPAVGAKPGEGYQAGAWDVTPSTETEIKENTTFIYTYAAQKGKSISYTTYEGEGGEYKHGSDGTLTFVFKRSEADSETFARFTGLKYDGRSLTRDKDYTAKAGSVIITLDHELLESMMVGNHILTAVFDDGEADAHFTVIANAEPTATPTATPTVTPEPTVTPTAAPTATPTPTPTPKPVPKTGDNSNPALWLAMMILGLAVLAGTAVKVYRKRQ